MGSVTTHRDVGSALAYAIASAGSDAVTLAPAFTVGGETPCLMQASNKFLALLLVEQLRPFPRVLFTFPSRSVLVRYRSLRNTWA